MSIYFRNLLNVKKRYYDILIQTTNSRIEIFDIVENLIANLDVEKDIILVGDFNCNLLAVTVLHITNRLLDIANLFQLK